MDPRDNSIVFTEKHLEALSKDVGDFLNSAGSDTTDSPRQVMVSGIEAKIHEGPKAWDGRDMSEWMMGPEGSEPAPPKSVKGRLLTKYQYSSLLDSKLAESQPNSSQPFSELATVPPCEAKLTYRDRARAGPKIKDRNLDN